MADYLGKKLKKGEADILLHTQQKIKHDVIRKALVDCLESKKTGIEKIETGLTDIAKVFYNDKFNAYVFSKDDIMRFFSGDPDNGTQPSPTADYLMILLATHPVDAAPYKKGDASVIIAGCKDTSGDKKRNFQTLAIDYPAAEHPQRSYKVNIDSLLSGDVIKLTLVSE